MERRRLVLNFVTEHGGRICSVMCPLIGRGDRPGRNEPPDVMCDAFGRIARDETTNMPLRPRQCFQAEAALDRALETAKAMGSLDPHVTR